MEHDILCIIDMQVDFVTGALKNDAAAAIIPKIVERIDKFDGCAIIATRDTHDINYLHSLEGEKLPVEHCLKNTPGHCIVPDISAALIRAEKRGKKIFYVDKETFGSLALQDAAMWAPVPVSDMISRFVLVGTCTGICVISNAVILKASHPNIPVCVIASECACLSPETHKTAVEAMRTMQIDVLSE